MFKLAKVFCVCIIVLFFAIACNSEPDKKNTVNKSNLSSEDLKIEMSIENIEKAMEDLEKAMEQIK